MSQILIVLNDKLTCEALRVKLPQKYGLEVIFKASSMEAKSFLEILPDIDILLCHDVIGNDQVAKKMCEYLVATKEEAKKEKDYQEKKDVSVVVIGKNAPEYNFATLLGENPKVDKIVMYIGFILGFEERNIIIEEEAIERERLESENREREIQERLRLEEEKRMQLEKEREERERSERDRLEKERLEKEKEEKKKQLEERLKRAQERIEKVEQERLEKEALEREKINKAKAKVDKELHEKAEKERLLREIQEAEKAAKDKIAFERAERERIELEKKNFERAEKERLLQEKLKKEKEEKERLEKEKNEEIQRIKTQEMRERIERGKARIAQSAKEKAENEKLENERIEKERIKNENEIQAKAKQREIESKEKIEKGKQRIAEVAKLRVSLQSQQNTKVVVENGKEKGKEIDRDDDSDKTTVFKMPVLDKTKPTSGVKPKVELSAEDQLSLKKVGLVPINIKYFLSIVDVNVKFNAFSRLKKQNDFEYSIKIAAGAMISKSEMERMIVRGVKELFVKESESVEIMTFLNMQFLIKFKNPQITHIQRIQINSDCFEILLEVFKNNSIDKYSVEMIKEMIKSIDILMKIPNPLQLFELAIKESRLSYGYKHSHLSCLCLFLLIDKFPWSKNQSKNKIIYLALFHDLTLHNERIIKLHHNYEKEKENISREDDFIISEHADSVAEILETIIKAPFELTSLVREHHGMKSGIGMPESLGFSLAPFLMAFVVTEDFVTKYLALKEKIQNEKIRPEQLRYMFDELKKKYNRYTYAEFLAEIQNHFESRDSE